jgi:starch synthase (maltosyl-transferring)
MIDELLSNTVALLRRSEAATPPRPRLVIENVTPQISGGRFPVKRIVGEVCRVEADIYKDGHTLISARICYRGPEHLEWQFAPLEHDYNPDRWTGSFRLDCIGRWRFGIEAWEDRFKSWARDLAKWFEAGEDVRAELREGAALLRRAAERATGETAEILLDRAQEFLIPDADLRPLIERALGDDVALLIDGPIDLSDLTRYRKTLEVFVDRERAGFSTWYEMFPRSQSTVPGQHGTLADAERRLPDLAELGFDVVYLPPIHPIGRTKRKGRNNARMAADDDAGSPWAIGSEEGGHTAVHPDLGTLEDFDRFVRTSKTLGMEVALDYALQCSPDHPWTVEHPEWFYRRPDGSIRYAENPPKKYEDIYPLDLWCEDRQELWDACRDILLFWVEHGVRIFRVDNPHTKPFSFWEWLIPELQRKHPDVILLSEAFTRPKKMQGLAKRGFTQSYTYFTWKNTSSELREHLTELTQTEMTEYFRPNLFTNTPDILHEYLQEGGRPAFRVRLLLAGTLSPTYGILSGFELCENVPLRRGSEEYLDSEKYQIRVRDWQEPGNIRDDIANINRIRRENIALRSLANLKFLESSNENILCYWKSAPGNELLIAVNLDPHRLQEAMVHVPVMELGLAEDQPFGVEDLLTGERYAWRGSSNYVRLDPTERVGHVLRVIEPGGRRGT